MEALQAEHLKDIDVCLFDCDGVLFRGGVAIEGASATMTALLGSGRRVFFATNNSTKSRQENAEKLSGMGMPCTAEQVLCSSYSAAKWAHRQGIGSVYVLGEQGIRIEMEQLGIKVVPDTDDAPTADLVVVGLDRNINYVRLGRAMRHLREGARYLATNTDASYPGEQGVTLPGAGAIVGALSVCHGSPPEAIAGKPSAWFVQLAQEAVGTTQMDRVLMVGDRLETDIAFGRAAGFQTLLVTETGVHSLQHASDSEPHLRPRYHTRSSASIGALLVE